MDSVDKNVLLVETQRGEALAELAINEARGQASAWHRIYVSLLALTAEGRAGFRSVTAKHAKEMREYVKANESDSAFAGTRRSALVRLSELNTITKAMDHGAKFESEWPFHYAVGYARTHLEGEGKADKRGRPAQSWEEKLRKYVEKNVPKANLDQALSIIATMAEAGEGEAAPV